MANKGWAPRDPDEQVGFEDAPFKEVHAKEVFADNVVVKNLAGITVTGSTWYDGNDAPPAWLGRDYDHYFTKSNDEVFAKFNDTWIPIANIKGSQGNAATIILGNTTVEPPGSVPWVTNLGDPWHANFSFGLPASPTVHVGSVVTGDAGSEATVTNMGNDYMANLAFVIPQGNAATIMVGTTHTGEPGTMANVMNVGTFGSANFAFTIPRGAQWLWGTVDPNSSVGWNGDMFLNGAVSGNSSGNLYSKENNVWTLVANLKGPVGSFTGTSDNMTEGSTHLFCNNAEKLTWNGGSPAIPFILALGG